MNRSLHVLMIVLFATSTVFAGGNKAEHEEWLKHAMKKETQRAMESQKHHGNTQRFEEKFGWLKEKQPRKFAELMQANKKAEAAWAAVARKCKTAKNPEELAALKATAHAAGSEAYIAEIALKFTGAAQERKDMAEKTGDSTVKKVARQLDANERDMLDAHRAKAAASAALQQFEIKNRELNKQLREAYEDARKKMHSSHKK